MNTSAKRAAQIENLRRKIRAHGALWGEMGDAKEDQCERILKATSKRLESVWRERHAQVLHDYGQRLLQTYA